ncbi:hypothetical protein CEUSTIGMA_g7030.t1 [Chlamydomonas eustigma]|uniref:Uncharacterized protein n=1 Tax=Chlamydomonas eustigma TaxID=1157962 RepID=A0A250X9M5_9CHLO|nr:hypothetical protein CEUSTIGMA_g7030.t1 [Chlamydomonas eustigma]|eukprot:GAX79589.1 hypothetical protein CEUSTIGMA_g7030.t1 [Chlamydomonas eustigma]
MTSNTAYEQWEEAEKTMTKEAVYQAACEIAEESSSDDEFGFRDPAIQSMPLPSPVIHLAEAGGGPAAAAGVKEISADRHVGIPTSAPPASNKRGKDPYIYEHRLRNRVILGSHLKERRILLKILHGDGTGRHPAGRLQEFRHLLKDYDTGLGLLAPEPPVLGQATAVADCQEGLHEQQSASENPEMFGDGEQSGMVNSFKSSNDVEVDEDLKELMQGMDAAIMDDQKEAAACAAENMMQPSAARKTDDKVSQMKNELQLDHMHAAKVPFHVVLHSAYRRMTQHQRRLAEGGSRRGSSDLDKMEQELGFCEEKDEADLVALQVAIAEATKGGSSEQICTAVAAAAKGYRENVVRHVAMGHSKAPTAVYDASVPPSMRTCSHDTVLCHQPTSYLPHYGTEKNPNHGDSALHLSKSQIRPHGALMPPTAQAASQLVGHSVDMDVDASPSAENDIFSKYPTEVPPDLLEGDFKEWFDASLMDSIQYPEDMVEYPISGTPRPEDTALLSMLTDGLEEALACRRDEAGLRRLQELGGRAAMASLAYIHTSNIHPPHVIWMLLQEGRLTNAQAEAAGLPGGGRDGVPPPMPPEGQLFVNPVPPFSSLFEHLQNIHDIPREAGPPTHPAVTAALEAGKHITPAMAYQAAAAENKRKLNLPYSPPNSPSFLHALDDEAFRLSLLEAKKDPFKSRRRGPAAATKAAEVLFRCQGGFPGSKSVKVDLELGSTGFLAAKSSDNVSEGFNDMLNLISRVPESQLLSYKDDMRRASRYAEVLGERVKAIELMHGLTDSDLLPAHVEEGAAAADEDDQEPPPEIKAAFSAMFRKIQSESLIQRRPLDHQHLSPAAPELPFYCKVVDKLSQEDWEFLASVRNTKDNAIKL